MWFQKIFIHVPSQRRVTEIGRGTWGSERGKSPKVRWVQIEFYFQWVRIWSNEHYHTLPIDSANPTNTNNQIEVNVDLLLYIFCFYSGIPFLVPWSPLEAKILRGGGQTGKNPPWGYGYFLHHTIGMSSNAPPWSLENDILISIFCEILKLQFVEYVRGKGRRYWADIASLSLASMLIYMFRLFQDFLKLSRRRILFIMHSNDLGYYLF